MYRATERRHVAWICLVNVNRVIPSRWPSSIRALHGSGKVNVGAFLSSIRYVDLCSPRRDGRSTLKSVLGLTCAAKTLRVHFPPKRRFSYLNIRNLLVWEFFLRLFLSSRRTYLQLRDSQFQSSFHLRKIFCSQWNRNRSSSPRWGINRSVQYPDVTVVNNDIQSLAISVLAHTYFNGFNYINLFSV